MDLNVNYYLGKYDSSTSTFEWHDLETYFNEYDDEVKYRRCSGLEDKGEPKNIYRETYADSSVVRAYIPDNVELSSTEITLDIVIKRGAREQSSTYDDLFGFLQYGITVFWDTQRQRAAVMVLKDRTSPNKDTYLGTPYLECEFKFETLYGECPYIEDTFSSGHLTEVEAFASMVISESLGI